MQKSILLIFTLSFIAGLMFFGCQQMEEPTSSLKTTDAKLFHGGCTYTPGWYKNHFEQWPVWDTGTPGHETDIKLGATWYTREEALSILKQPTKGNGLVILGRAYIAARINVFRLTAIEGFVPQEVLDAINDAHFLAGSLVIPPVGSDKVKPNFVKDEVSLQDVATLLDDFNNGIIGPGHCD